MNVEAYVTARYGRLLERAVELGCPEGQAAEYVDQVLVAQRRRILRADDPDPLVHEALERAIRGGPEPSSRGWVVAVLLVGVAVTAVLAVTYDPPPAPLPSLFGYDADRATEVLEAEGFEVLQRPARACEPQGLVLGSTPRVGELVEDGATVTVRTAVPSDVFCLGTYLDRADAWAFVGFARGGPPPEFADRVDVIVDGSAPATFTGGDADLRERWGRTLDLLEDVAETPVDTRNGMPSLTVTSGTPPERYCGRDRPPQGGEREALRLAVDTTPDDQTAACPLTVDLYRFEGVIDSVVVYTAAAGGGVDTTATSR